jgi:nitrogen fixation-related uncharacterized protein
MSTRKKPRTILYQGRRHRILCDDAGWTWIYDKLTRKSRSILFDDGEPVVVSDLQFCLVHFGPEETSKMVAGGQFMSDGQYKGSDPPMP